MRRRVVWLLAGTVLAVTCCDSLAAMMHHGSMAPFPDLAHASAADRAQVDHLVQSTWADSQQFDTVVKARRQGYRFSRRPQTYPGVRHMRKHGVHFWGRVLDPHAPQALLWWCVMPKRCTLIGVMYRAPARSHPPTYGGLLGWHNHSAHATWMTHVWLSRTVRTALARCVPERSLRRDRGVRFASYVPDVPEDFPCPGPPGGLMRSHGMGHR